MEANNFVAKLKANGTASDLSDLDKIYKEYKIISSKLSAKDRGAFSLNVLCILCRNLDKVPKWGESIDAKELLVLSIDCVRETRSLNKPEQVKTLACIYHIHRYVIRQNSPVPPELILKLSIMPFESEKRNLLTEYCKTYWNVLADRITYIEKIRNKSIQKLLPKLTEDILKTIDLYDSVQFCGNILTFLVKKLHQLYNDVYSEQLNTVYMEIFKQISMKNDLKSFKKLSEKESLDLYVKFNDCYYVIAENASKTNFKESALNIAIQTGLSLLGHQPSIFHCLQTFYLNSFCNIFNNNTYIHTIFKNIMTSCEMTKKLGYNTTLIATYPFLNQFLRLFIEYSVNNSIKDNFIEETQGSCLSLMLHLMNELRNCAQLLKCENCSVKSGYHDSLRLSFLLKHFITNSINNNMAITSLELLYNKIVTQQYYIMAELKKLGCVNYEKCFRKLQTDTHNTAILLNKSKNYEFSIKLFDIYLKNELALSKHEMELKNVARALYNKGICELDAKLYEDALLDAFLSLVYAQELSTDKYMSLVLDIKAKALKAMEEDEGNDNFQLTSVFEACKIAIEKNIYGDLKPFLCNLKFSALLKHEYTMYTKLWPSIVPIAGVWRSLHCLTGGHNEDWIKEDADIVFWTLFEIISETPSVVRTIHNDHFNMVVTDMLARVERMPEPLTADVRVIHTTLLFLKAEYDLAEASVKYGWKVSEPTMDPDTFQATKTLPQEHAAIEKAIRAVEIWTELSMEIDAVTKTSCLQYSLQLAQIFVQQLLYLGSVVHGLQLAHVCCQVARFLGDKEVFVRNAGVLLYHMDRQTDDLQNMACLATEYWAELTTKDSGVETALIFLCDVAIYYSKCGFKAASARLVQMVQARTLEAFDRYPDLNLDLAVGRLMEAQTMLCKNSGPSSLSAVSGTQRHYLSVSSSAPKWSTRRLNSATLKYHTSTSSISSTSLSRSLLLLRRARSWGGAALAQVGAHAQATLYARCVNAHKMDDAQVKIDNRLKYILGLQMSSDQPSNPSETKIEAFTPKQDLETMLESQLFKKNQLSPIIQWSIPRFRLPSYFRHKNCECYACCNPNTLILSCLTFGLEASMYFRANEFDIAENYFSGVKDMISIFDVKLKEFVVMCKKLEFQSYIIDYVKTMYENDFRGVQLEVLIEAAFFEMRIGNFDNADDYIITIHEILQETENIDQYLRNEVMNLMITSARVKNIVKVKENIDLINEFDNLKLSPAKEMEAPTTPETKSLKIPTVSTKIVVKDEEIPKKRKVIKLNLDEGSSDEKEPEKTGRRPRKPEFKIPGPITSKPVLESITPRVLRKPDLTMKNKDIITKKTDTTTRKTDINMKNPDITITDTSNTPKIDKNTEFFTPQSTPEQFFTPVTSLKTYSKSLRRGIVKNLEQEFSTPVAEKENKLEAAGKSRRDKERVKRATSPGKLVKEGTVTRSRRKPAGNFKLDDN